MNQTECEETEFKKEFDALTEYGKKLDKMFKEDWPGQYRDCAKRLIHFTMIIVVHLDLNSFIRTFQEKTLRAALVHVFFKDMGVTKFTRDQLFGWQDIVGIEENNKIQLIQYDMAYIL